MTVAADETRREYFRIMFIFPKASLFKARGKKFSRNTKQRNSR